MNHRILALRGIVFPAKPVVAILDILRGSFGGEFQQRVEIRFFINSTERIEGWSEQAIPS